MFQQHNTDLVGLGKTPLTDHIVMSTEKFICKMYGVPEVDTCNKARVKLFCIGRAHETLPPTSDATKFHIIRAQYQASVWHQAHLPCPDLLPVTEMGWMHLDGKLVPQLLSLPLIPKSCREITSCVHAVQMDVLPNAAAVGKFAWSASKCVLVRDVLTSVEIFTTT